MPAPGTVLRAILSRWRSYRYRFVPWVALNLTRNRRTLRCVSAGRGDKVVADDDVSSSLVTFFRVLFTWDIKKQTELLTLLPSTTRAMYPAPDASGQQHRPHHTVHPEDAIYKCLGFCIDRRPSSMEAAGTGVFVSKGCLDGILIDGSDKRISKSVYRSCSRRDQLGPLKMCDCTWLTSAPHNPLAVGQYVNNCSNVHEANVCYQEFDVPASFPVELRQYIPNVRYSHDVEGPLRCVVLVALRDIRCGEELFSNYFTLIQ
ncbi:SET domain-containing protein 9 isoform X2 [Phyllobates terribilis]|uniref:SET domain-containing protein 9 isoform X2 n=1 Tax=Phyllobates terribilis TaxID=111132 RepID=UPI003CCA6DFE